MTTLHLALQAIRLAALMATICAPAALFGQANFQTLTFESQTVGAGNLTPSFSFYAFGPTSLNGGSGNFITSDPIQGVAASSVIGTGQAGYLGGGGTNVTLNGPGSAGGFGVEAFNGSAANNATTTVQLIGSANYLATFSLDFAIHRAAGTNQQSFYFTFYDGENAAGSGFATHSEVYIDPTNAVFIKDNQSSSFINSSLTLSNDTAYHLGITVNYNTATWSASMTTGATNYTLATNRAINGSGYTVSGYTNLTSGIGDIYMYAATSSTTNAGFADRLYFDNLNTSAIPEPSTYATFAGAGALLLAAIRRRGRAAEKV
jgi:hypothetical protein